MRRADFAFLCQISRPMLSKYERSGDIVVTDGEVDAAESLAKLAGRLAEDKRQTALLNLTGLGERRSSSGAMPPLTRPASSTLTTPRQERDAVARDLMLLQYGRQAGELVLVADVEDGAAQAVAAMREAFANGSRDLANKICATFGLSTERAPPLKRLLSADFERILGQFAESMAALSAPQSPAANTDSLAEATA